MPKWARTTRAGAYRANLGEASGKQGTRQVHVDICTTFFRGIVQDGAEGYVRCYSYSCCGWCFSPGPRYLKVRPQNLHPLRHPSDERPRGGVLKEFFEVPDDLVWATQSRYLLRILQSHVVFAAEVSVKSCTNTVASCSPRSLFEQRLGVASLISDFPSAPCQVKMSINACFARMM